MDSKDVRLEDELFKLRGLFDALQRKTSICYALAATHLKTFDDGVSDISSEGKSVLNLMESLMWHHQMVELHNRAFGRVLKHYINRNEREVANEKR